MHKFNLRYISRSRTAQLLREEEEKAHVLSADLQCREYAGSIVLPSKDWTPDGLLYGGAVDSDGHYISQSGYREDGSLPYAFDEHDVVEYGGEAVFIGFFLNCYGHGITDHIKKLWYLNTTEFKALKAANSQVKIIYLVEKNLPLPAWQKEIFRLAGFDSDEWEQATSVTRFKKLYVPDNSLVNDHEYRMYAPQFRETIESIRQRVGGQPVSAKKVYFTRTGIKNPMRECGEERVERVFRKKGFEVFAPEQLTVSQQIALMMGCDVFASTEGSCAHNSIFCKKGTKVLILRKADYVNSYQCMINAFAGLDVTYIDIHHSSRADKAQPWHGPFYMYVSPDLQEYFHLHLCLPYFLDPLYWVYSKYKWNLYFRMKKLLVK